MNTIVVLYMTVVLMAVVAVVCTALCLAWSIPSWRSWIGRRPVVSIETGGIETRSLNGWPDVVGNLLVSLGIAACAGVGWYGCYNILAALIASS